MEIDIHLCFTGKPLQKPTDELCKLS